MHKADLILFRDRLIRAYFSNYHSDDRQKYKQVDRYVYLFLFVSVTTEEQCLLIQCELNPLKAFLNSSVHLL